VDDAAYVGAEERHFDDAHVLSWVVQRPRNGV